MNKQIKQDCLLYFKANPVWKRILQGFKKKYISYGTFSGKVVVNNVTLEEIEELEGFFGKNFHGKKSVSVSATNFRKALENSRFREITPEWLLESFFQEPLMGKREEQQLRERRKLEILQRFTQNYTGTPAMELMFELQNLIPNQDFVRWEKLLFLAAEIVNRLPYRCGQQEYLAIFAVRLTGNPHAFDYGTTEGALLYQIIQMDLNKRNVCVTGTPLFPRYKQQRCYLAAGILLDDVSNYAMLYNVQAIKQDEEMHQGIAGFLQENDMVQVPLASISKWEKICCVNQEMYIVENPAVFAVLCGKTHQENLTSDISCMCMNGQPRLAGLVVLELLAKSGTKIYYAGDFDPEGLLIAQKLSQFYEGEFRYWHMTTQDYECCKSKEVISDKRLKSLKKIKDENLVELAEQIKRSKRAGYQEALFL